MPRPGWRIPPATAVIFAVVLIIRLLQWIVPGWYAALARDPSAPWWRVVTALFAYDDGWPQIIAIAAGVLVLGVIGERYFGSWRWLGLFLIAGLVGQLFGLAWQPVGAGSSVAVAGLAGAVAVRWLLRPGIGAPAFARIGPFLILAGGAYLAAVRDIHGPPVFVGAGLAALALLRG
jgi:rhomboid protease GluP